MNIKKIKIDNYGPIASINYEFEFDEVGNPKPLVLIGKNGSGKTLFVSNIVQSLIELKRKKYKSLNEVVGENFYRVASKLYIKSGTSCSCVQITYNDNSIYSNAMCNDINSLKDLANTHNYQVDFNNQKLKDEGFYYNANLSNPNSIDENVFLYFPVDRFYKPTWLNEDNDDIHLNTSQNYTGKTRRNIICQNLLENVESYILDLVLDQKLYEEQTSTPNIEINRISKDVADHSGRATNRIRCINKILANLYHDKYDDVRIGVSKKVFGTRSISIIGINSNGDEDTITNSISNLSSGEIMIFTIACKILMDYDIIASPDQFDMTNITGIVVIDEIDVHLHSDFAMKIAPTLISLFPKIQFVMSSHSPFFLLGMKEKYKDNVQFLNLPEGILLPEIEDFDEIKKTYDLIDEKISIISKELNNRRNTIKQLTKPLIITEGKSDWKHFKNALQKLKKIGLYTNLDIDFYEYDCDMGDSKLYKFLTDISKVPNNHKIIGIFDTDKNFVESQLGYDLLGNNVYKLAITNPQNYECGISVEMMYYVDDLKLKDNQGRRLFLTNEFKPNSGVFIQDSKYICCNKTLKDAKKRTIIKVVDSEVYNSDNDESVALSKEDFAFNILNQVPPFDKVNVDCFRELFDRIIKVIEEC